MTLGVLLPLLLLPSGSRLPLALVRAGVVPNDVGMFGRNMLRGGDAVIEMMGVGASERGTRVRVRGVGDGEGEGEAEREDGVERSMTTGDTRRVLRIMVGGDVVGESMGRVGEIFRALRVRGGDAGERLEGRFGLRREEGGCMGAGGTFGRSSCRLEKDCTRLAGVGEGLADGLLLPLPLLLLSLMMRVRLGRAVTDSASGSEVVLARWVPRGLRTGAAAAATRAAGFALVSCKVACGDTGRSTRPAGKRAASVGEV